MIMDPNIDAEDKVKAEISRIIGKDPRAEEVSTVLNTFEHGIRAEVKLRILPYNVEEFLYLNYVREIEEGGN